MARVAAALAVAHGKGIIHRDLKPANIMVNERLEPIVVDFGLARGSHAFDAGATILGDVVGTPAYLAPEQADGVPERIGPLCDVYSLGVVLYELLTGRAPFDGTPLAIFKQVLTREPDPPSRHRPDVNARLEAICMTAMARDPRARYSSMDALATALEIWLKDPDSTKASPTHTAPKRVTRRRWTIAVGALIVAGLVPIIKALPRPRQTQPLTVMPLPAGSCWVGTYRFRPPIRDISGNVRLTITERQDGAFRGIYETESRAFAWEIQGTVRREEVLWTLTKAIRGEGAVGSVGTTRVNGRITEDRIEAVYRDHNSVADLVLIKQE